MLRIVKVTFGKVLGKLRIGPVARGTNHMIRGLELSIPPISLQGEGWD